MSFEAIYTDKPVDRMYSYSPAVIHRRSGLLFISGVCGWDRDGNILHADNPALQARVAFENLHDILKASGASFSNVIWETEYIVDIRQYREIAKIREEFFAGHKPAATLVGATFLFKVGQLFEIQVIAATD